MGVDGGIDGYAIRSSLSLGVSRTDVEVIIIELIIVFGTVGFTFAIRRSRSVSIGWCYIR